MTGPKAQNRSSWAGPVPLAWSAVCSAVLVSAVVDQWRTLSAVCRHGSCIPLQLDPAAASALSRAEVTPAGYAAVIAGFSAVFGAALFVLALLVTMRAQRPAAMVVPPILLAMGATAVTTSEPGGSIGALQQVVLCVAVAGLFYVIATFPTLTFVPRWTLGPTAVAVGWAGVTTLLPRVATDVAADRGGWAAAEGPVFAVALVAILAGQAIRYRRGSSDVRRQTGLVLASAAVLAVVGVGGAISAIDPPSRGIGTLTGTIWQLAGTVALTLVMASIAVAVIRERAYGLDAVVRNTLVAALLIAGVIALYSAVVAALSVLVDGWLPGAVGAAAVALVLAPARARLVRVVDRLVYGDAGDPLSLTTALSHCLADARSSVTLLPTMIDLVAARLRLPHVAVSLNERRESVTAGDDVKRPLTWRTPLGLDPDQVGVLAAGPRPGQRRLSARDRAALTAAAWPLTAAVVAVRLAEELERSRTALVTAREEERRALRRHLHDEFGPTLASLRHRVNAARRDLDAAPAQADQRLSEVDDLVAGLFIQVRELARGLRPPELDELGLVGALARFADGLGLSTGFDARLSRPLPAAVEVAAYRIAVEALLNADRHGRATRATIVVHDLNARLRIEVTDDGIGPDSAGATGVGLISMRERVDELRGRLTLGHADNGGAHLVCELPLPIQEAPAS